jgi:hypothetical protein
MPVADEQERRKFLTRLKLPPDNDRQRFFAPECVLSLYLAPCTTAEVENRRATPSRRVRNIFSLKRTPDVAVYNVQLIHRALSLYFGQRGLDHEPEHHESPGRCRARTVLCDGPIRAFLTVFVPQIRLKRLAKLQGASSSSSSAPSEPSRSGTPAQPSNVPASSKPIPAPKRAVEVTQPAAAPVQRKKPTLAAQKLDLRNWQHNTIGQILKVTLDVRHPSKVQCRLGLCERHYREM